ncbi:MAG TPA: AraC family transcriptional regulator [Firmicutes bacterium]|nr:AraC family transcriptional regulator [Bacillota bacterium]
MEDLKARVAYLRGLAEGMKLESSSPNGKLLHEVITVLDQVADAISELNDTADDIDEYLEKLDDDLRELEEEVYGEEGVIEVTCPHCGETVCVDEDLDEDENLELRCPNCGELIYENDSYDADEDADTIDNKREDTEGNGDD